MAKKRYYDKKMSKADGEMIAGKVGQAMMPQDVIMKFYPKNGSYLTENINDGMSGIDKQVKADASGTKRELSPTKY
jgi:hypothetical protein